MDQTCGESSFSTLRSLAAQPTRIFEHGFRIQNEMPENLHSTAARFACVALRSAKTPGLWQCARIPE